MTHRCTDTVRLIQRYPTQTSSGNLRLSTYVVTFQDEAQQESVLKPRNSLVPPANASFLMYLKSIVHMPKSLRMLCITNLFSWMSHVCYSLYFTDFVGEAVFGGNPQVFIFF